MNRASMKALIPFVVIIAVAIAAVVFLGDTDTDGDGGGPAELPAAQEDAGGVPVEVPAGEVMGDAEPSAAVVDPSVTVQDPVPDDVVAVLFDLIEAQDVSPLMQETYTVEFVETTDKVHVEGEFEDGPREFEFEFEDGAWKLGESS